MIKLCKSCNTPFEVFGYSNHIYYCSYKCCRKEYYKRNKEKIYSKIRKYELKNISKVRIWRKKALDNFRKNRPERFRELMRNYYYRNKNKNASRKLTLILLNQRKIFIPNVCAICKTNKKLEIHHKTYPITSEGIELAVRQEKIFKLCKKHHIRQTYKKFKTLGGFHH